MPWAIYRKKECFKGRIQHYPLFTHPFFFSLSSDYWVSDSTTEESGLQEGKQTARRVDSEERCKAKREWKAEEGGWGGCSLCPQSPCLLTLDSAFWDHTTQNLIRIGLACVVLTAVVWLLAEDWLSRKRDQEGTNRSASWECRRRWRAQRSLEEEQRDAISMSEVKATPGPGTIWALCCPLEEGRGHCRNEGVVSLVRWSL